MRPTRSLFLAASLLAATQAAPAATLTVADGEVALDPGNGRCSLTEAILNANAIGSNRDLSAGDCVAGSLGADTIDLAPASVYIFTAAYATSLDYEDAALPAITSAITLNGHGAKLLRGATDPGCGSNRFRHLHIAPTGNLTLIDAELRWGCAYNDGGAILDRGSLTVVGARLLDNTSYGAGGALFISGGAVAVLDDVTASGNKTYSSGGAIHNSGTLNLSDSRITGNRAESGAGGGITTRGPTTLTQSTLDDNFSYGGGGGLNIDGNVAVDIDNSTLAGNRSNGDGGAILLPSSSSNRAVRVRSSTIADNRGNSTRPGITQDGSGSYTVDNSVLIENRQSSPSVARPTGEIGNCVGAYIIPTSVVTNDTSCFGTTILTALNSASFLPLAGNGGATPTMALPWLSPMVDIGNNTKAQAVSSVDQRGDGYDRIIGVKTDLGAYEQGAGDGDGDGVPDALEDGVNASGDGNGDGIADSVQAFVASRPVYTGDGYLTLALADDSLQLHDVAVAPEPLDVPAGAAFPYGQLSFSVSGVTTMGTVAATATLPDDARIAGFHVRANDGQWEDIATSVQHGNGHATLSLLVAEGGSTDRDADGSRIAVYAEKRAPLAPDSVIASIAGSNVHVIWSPALNGGSPILGYVVQTSEQYGYDIACPQTLDSPNAATCDYSLFSAGAGTRQLRVAARNAYGIGDFQTASFVKPTEPMTPIAIAVEPHADHYVLSWQPPYGDGGDPITGYQVTYSAGGGNVTGGSCGNTGAGAEPQTRCVVSISDPTVLYGFAIRARNTVGTSTNSGLSGTPAAPTPPGTPLASAGDTQVALQWDPPSIDANAYVYDYRIERASNGGGSWIEAAGSCADAVVSSTPACIDTGLSNGVAVRYRVRAVNAAGTSLTSDESTDVTPVADAGSDDLIALNVTDQAISPVFDPATTSYSLDVPAAIDSITLRAAPRSSIATFTVNGDLLAADAESAALPLVVGANTIEVTVNGNKTYSIEVQRADAGVAPAFASLSVNDGSTTTPLSTAGSQSTLSFDNGVASLSLDVEATATDALIKLDGTTVGTGSVTALNLPLVVGRNLHFLRIEQAGNSDLYRSYTLDFTRRYPGGLLAALSSDVGELSPAFSSGTTSYDLTVGNDTESLRLTAEALDPDGARITIAANPTPHAQPSAPIALAAGSTAINVSVQSRDNAYGSYTVNVHREGDSSLLGLGTSPGTLSPEFDPAVQSYIVDVDSTVSSIDVRAVLRDPGAGLKINDVAASSGAASTVSLPAGVTAIPVEVTPSTGSARTYTLTINRGLPTFTVTPSAGTGGSIAPSAAQAVVQGQRAVFELAPDSGFRTASVDGTCGGSLANDVFVTDPVGADCTVVASFEAAATVPDAPQDVSGTAGDGQVLVSWSAPASDGGAAISGYIASATPVAPASGGTATCSSSGSTSCSILGLVNGVAYSLSVVASNAEGSSAAATAATAITPVGTPTAPISVSVAQTSQNSAVISWIAPANSGGLPIQSYAVTSTPAGATCSSSGSPAPLSCTVGNLVQGQTYTFAVTASNGVNTGPAASSDPLFVGTGVDISVSVRRVGINKAGKTFGPLQYVVDVTNNGSQVVSDLQLQVSPVSLLNVSWSCVAPAPCSPGTGSDAVDTRFGLGVGQTASIEITGDLESGRNFVQLVATATLPSGVMVVQQQDDRTTYTENVTGTGVMLNGFE